MFSTVEDMAHFAMAQLPGNPAGLIEPGTLRMAHALTVQLGEGMSLGLGWMVREENGVELPFYEGGGSGMSSGLYLFPEQDMAVVAMFNAAAYPATWAIGRGVTRSVQGQEPAPVGPVLFQRIGAFSLRFMAPATVAIVVAGAVAILPASRKARGFQRAGHGVLALGALAAFGGPVWQVVVALPSPSNPMSELTALPFRSTWHGWPVEWVSMIAVVGMASLAVLLAAAWKLWQLREALPVCQPVQVAHDPLTYRAGGEAQPGQAGQTRFGPVS